MNKLKLAKHILLICFSASIFIFSLVLFILSKSDSGVYNWTLSNGKEFYERDIEFDKNAVIGMLIGISFIIYSIYTLLQEKKNLSNEKGYLVMINVVPLLVSFYSLSVFFKALVKAIVKANKAVKAGTGITFAEKFSEEFVYQSYQLYLYIGIITLIFFAYGVLSAIEYKNKKKSF